MKKLEREALKSEEIVREAKKERRKKKEGGLE